MASYSVVPITRMLKRIEINNCFKYSVLISENLYIKNTLHLRRWRGSSRRFSSDVCTSDQQPPTVVNDNKEVTISYFRGLPQVTVPLPSRKEKCRFTLRPVSNTVGDFLEMLKTEDKGIDRVSILSAEGVRIASSNSIEVLMEDNFRLLINDNSYFVETPQQERLTKEEIKRLSDVRNLVNQLYEALNVEEHQLQKERELQSKLEHIKQELHPLEIKRQELEIATERKTNVMTWVGLGMMSVQFGILARLTWWEYSWDIMEPVTYFVTYGTAMAAYAYFVLTKQEYILPDVRDRQHLLTLHKRARKIGLDLDKYNLLKDQVRNLEKDLRRLRDPLNIHLPPAYTQVINRSKLDREESAFDKLKKLVNKGDNNPNC